MFPIGFVSDAAVFELLQVIPVERIVIPPGVGLLRVEGNLGEFMKVNDLSPGSPI